MGRSTRYASPSAIRATTILAGVVGAGLMWWTWRGMLGVPLELTVALHMDPAMERVRPWAPWWVPVTLMALLTAALWRLAAARARGISIMAGTIVLLLANYLTYTLAMICLEYGAMAQYQPLPPLMKMLLALPLVLLGGAQITLVHVVLALPIGPVVMLVGCLLVSVTAYGIGRLLSPRAPAPAAGEATPRAALRS